MRFTNEDGLVGCRRGDEAEEETAPRSMYVCGVFEMKWRFDCYACGERWEEEHRNIGKAHFIYSAKKEGRPMKDCYRCKIDFVYTPIMGDMIGGRQ